MLPTRNGMPRLKAVLDALLAQRCRAPYEIYCVDSESSDGTWEELCRRGARGARIARREFEHGATRNRAAAATDGELIAFIVQDAVPADEEWLDRLVGAVLSAEDVAGAYSRQLPHPGLNPFLRARLESWSAGRTEPRVQRLAAGQTLAGLPPLGRLDLCAFDNVASIMRRSVWERFPLPARRFGEDVAWGRQVIEAGLAIAFEPRSVVLHSHEAGALAEFRRLYLDHANLCDLFGVVTVPTLRHALRSSRSQLRAYRDLARRAAASPEEETRLLRLARRLAPAETFGQWLGARSVRMGPPRGLFRLIERFAAR